MKQRNQTIKQKWFSCDDLNKKALHEAIFYFLFEKVECKNNELKHLIITNFKEFYIFDAQDVAKAFFYEGSSLVKEFKKWSNKLLNRSLNGLSLKTVIPIQSKSVNISQPLPTVLY
ncbi:MAG: hypothetical protein QNJ31_01035 [Candidatus Caenarcaniphilales bacterium]|nr:hypothetical protein [Candidatus Caenarcaniphilales bacterium]